ncbi:MAG TPA: type II toxin-antitoxin system PemK/MazF family toxin [Acetobacteraceae bacterium]
MTDGYVPERGDFARMVLDPLTGREQGGERPVLVLSTREFNLATRYALVAPITRTVRDWPFEVPIGPGQRVAGLVLSDQTRSVDFVARHARLLGKAPAELVAQVLARVASIVEG